MAEAFDSLSALFPSSSDGGSDSSDSDTGLKAKKQQKKRDPPAIVAYENAQQSGLYGRKPRDLTETTGHNVYVGKLFVSR